MGLPTEAKQVGPSGVMLGDTYPFATYQLTDENGDPTPYAEYTIGLECTRATGEQFILAGLVDGDDATKINFAWDPSTETDTAGSLQTMVKVTRVSDDLKLSLAGEYFSIYDTTTMWCTPADVILIVGDGYSTWEILEAIALAEAVVRAWVTVPVGSPVPERVSMATAILAARVLTSEPGSGTGGAIEEERIADYSVVYSNPEDASVWLIDDELQAILLPWRPRTYMTDVGEVRSPVDDDTEGYYP